MRLDHLLSREGLSEELRFGTRSLVVLQFFASVTQSPLDDTYVSYHFSVVKMLLHLNKRI